MNNDTFYLQQELDLYKNGYADAQMRLYNAEEQVKTLRAALSSSDHLADSVAKETVGLYRAIRQYDEALAKIRQLISESDECSLEAILEVLDSLR